MSSSIPTPGKRPKAPTIEEAILIVIVILSLAGIAITHFSPQDAYLYWMAMILPFGILAVVAGWFHAKAKGYLYIDGHPLRNLWLVQTLHWLAAVAAVACVFTLTHTGRMDSVATGLVVLILLGLSIFVDGIRIGWRFCVAGIYLAAAAVIANYTDKFMLILFGIAILVIAVTVLWTRYRTRRAAP